MPVPPISVVMPVRNALPYLDEAVSSILDQTFRDFELVIGDDGSTDGSTVRLREWAARDSRIRLLERKPPSLGPVGSADWVARAATAPFVARMDADDVSRADRLERQVEVLRSNPDVVMVGSLWEGIDERSNRVHGRDRSRLIAPGDHPFIHGSVAWRRETFEAVGGYRPGTDYWEDGDLFVRMAAAGRVLVIVHPLYRFRWSPGSTHFDERRSRVEESLQVGLLWGESEDPARVDVKTLERWRAEVRGKRVDPRIFLLAAYRRVWSGRRAGILLPMLRRGRLRLDRTSLHALLWAVAGGIAPRLLREIVRRRLVGRDRRAAHFVADDDCVEWPLARSG